MGIVWRFPRLTSYGIVRIDSTGRDKTVPFVSHPAMPSISLLTVAVALHRTVPGRGDLGSAMRAQPSSSLGDGTTGVLVITRRETDCV
jgi:hypothetical protein